MDTRRALLLAIALGGATLVWTATRYARAVEPGHAEASAPAGERVTLRFFRNPAPAPHFVARDLDGHELSTASLRGKVVIINFWATWCGPCRAEIPDLVALQEKYRDRLQVIGISQDESPPDVVRRFAAQFRVNYPVVMMTPELERLFPGIGALPTSFIVDRESRIVQKHVGMLRASTTELEARSLAGLPVDSKADLSAGKKGGGKVCQPPLLLVSFPRGKPAFCQSLLIDAVQRRSVTTHDLHQVFSRCAFKVLLDILLRARPR